MDVFFDGIFHGLFSAIDPLGMVLRTLMALLADALAQVVTGLYAQLFEITTADFTLASLGSIWKITTGVSASVATILLVTAAFRAMVAQSSRYLVEAIPGVALALIGPQAASLLLPAIAAAFTDLAQVIVTAATPDLAASMRLLAGVGSNALYEGLGLMAPLVAAMLLFGLTSVFFVLLFCMAGAVVLYALSPFAFAGLVMAPTRTWFRKWATAMFSLLFAKVPIAILLALSVSLFANSAHTGTTQAFVNAGAGLILGVGALLAPLMAYGLFSFMGTVATKPAVPATNPARALGTAYYGSQMGRAGVNAGRKVVTSARDITTRTADGTGANTPAQGGTGRGGASVPAPHEPTAAARSAGAPVTHPTPTGTATRSAATPATAGGAGATATASGTAATATAAGAATGGVAAVVIAGGATASKAAGSMTGAVVGAASHVASPAGYTQHGSGLLVPDTPNRPPTPSRTATPPPHRDSSSGGTPAGKPIVGPPNAHRVTPPPA
jgi:hypothetical protein